MSSLNMYFFILFFKFYNNYYTLFKKKIVIFLHAGLRLRNLKNKITNKIENIGLNRTPMGWILEKLGASNEAAS